MCKRITSFAIITIALLIGFSSTIASACPGDFDGNGSVNIADFLAFVNVFGTSSADANYNAQMDLDSNGSVEIADFLAFVNVFGTTCESQPPPGGGSGGGGETPPSSTPVPFASEGLWMNGDTHASTYWTIRKVR